MAAPHNTVMEEEKASAGKSLSLLAAVVQALTHNRLAAVLELGVLCSTARCEGSREILGKGPGQGDVAGWESVNLQPRACLTQDQYLSVYLFVCLYAASGAEKD